MSTLRPIAKCSTATLREESELAARRRFRELRLRLFRTQLAAAVALGVDDSSVERWESGATKVPGWAREALELIADGAREKQRVG